MDFSAHPSVLIQSVDRSADTLTVAEFGEAIETEIPELDLHVSSDYDDALQAIADAEIVISRYLPNEMLNAATNLKWIQSYSAGVDQYPIDRLAEDEILLTTASGVHAEPIAEQVLAYMLAFERQLHVGFRRQQAHRWERFSGGELAEKTVGIIGVGAIGTRVAELSAAFDMTVLGGKRDTTTVPPGVDTLFSPGELHTLLGQSDYVVVSCPLTPDTHELLGIKEFSSMKDSAVLINIARGEIVQQRHLHVAIANGSIGGAALDVADSEPLPADSPLWNLENVIITPHMAGSTPKYFSRLKDLFVDNYSRVVSDGPEAIRNRVI